jgi:hypothetical protein
MRSTAQSIGRKCEICEPPLSICCQWWKWEVSVVKLAVGWFFYSCCGTNDEMRAMPPATPRAESATDCA